ncbi:MAG TPA: TraR/DksA C4-type zinc finger protein [Gammaproteobacteria bacterium]|nr:TraR/DksA C4-type zinc finger protein [Gammaproteobacteria bacterium]
MARRIRNDQINALKQILQRRFFELREEIRQELLRTDQAPYIELAGQVHDAEEEAVADLLVDLNLAEIDRHVRELREVDAALKRIAEGTYGICEDTGEPIPYARLKAEPTARRSVAAQAAYERTHEPAAHPKL